MSIKYKRFDQMMASVESDLSLYADEGYIDRSKYIKEARRVNADLGLKINRERQTILDVKGYKACLPDDFQFLQLALICTVEQITGPVLGGAHTEDVKIPLVNKCNTCLQDPCKCNYEFKVCDGSKWVVQTIGIKTQKYEKLEKICLTQASYPYCSDNCLNIGFRSEYQMNINGETASFSFPEGKVYINYLADMVDDDGNLLILDHDSVNDYYEYSVKKKFFENMILGKDGDFVNAFKLLKGELREAKIKAINFISIPEYEEIQCFYEQNRRRFYNNYIGYFNNPDQGRYNV